MSTSASSRPTLVRVRGELTAEEAAGLVQRSEVEGVVLKEDARSRVVRLGTWVVKRYRLPRWKAAVYGALRVSPAWREWRGGQTLADLGMRVSPAAALVRVGGVEALVLPWIDGPTVADVLRDDGGEVDRLTLARRLGAQAGRLSAAGWVNRDYKPTNLIVDAACRGGAEPVMIDLAGVVRRRSDAQALRMLALLDRAARSAGPVRRVEAVACVKAFLEAAPSGPAGRREQLRAAIQKLRSDV